MNDDPPPAEADETPGEGLRDSSLGGHAAGAAARLVFVVEDEFLVALLLEEELRTLGFSVVGPFMNVATAIEASRREQFEFAILDVNLGGEMVFLVADELSARGIPFLFVSGYGQMSLPEKHRATPWLAKPCERSALAREINRLLSAHRRK